MKFIESLKPLLLVTALLLSSACQFIPTASEPIATVDSETDEQRSINPYYVDRPVVPVAAQQAFDRASAALVDGNWSEAEKELTGLTDAFPEWSGPYMNLALLYQSTGQLDKVAPAFEQAIMVNARNIYAYNQYAIFQREQGDFSKAEQLYLQALAVWPDYPDGHLNLAILYDLYQGKLDLALKHYQRYQDLQDKPDPKVSGWIIDTERRSKNRQSAMANQ